MLKSSPTGVVQPAEAIPNNRHQKYTLQLLALPVEHEIRKILPETVRNGDLHAQSGVQEQSN